MSRDDGRSRGDSPGSQRSRTISWRGGVDGWTGPPAHGSSPEPAGALRGEGCLVETGGLVPDLGRVSGGPYAASSVEGPDRSRRRITGAPAAHHRGRDGPAASAPASVCG